MDPFQLQECQRFEFKFCEITPGESNAEEVSFEWSHLRTSSTDSKVRTTLNEHAVCLWERVSSPAKNIPQMRVFPNVFL